MNKWKSNLNTEHTFLTNAGMLLMPWSLNPPTFELRAGFTVVPQSFLCVENKKLLTLQLPEEQRTFIPRSSLSTDVLMGVLSLSAWLMFGA